MLPLIPPGASVMVEPLRRPPQVGDVVVRIQDRTAVAHRVVWRRRFPPSQDVVLDTKGDYFLHSDPPAELKDIVGIVRSVRVCGKEGEIRMAPLPRLTGIWVAHLSHLLGVLNRILCRRTGAAGQGKKPRKSIGWFFLSFFRQLGRKAILFAAREFSPRVSTDCGVTTTGADVSRTCSSAHGKTASR
jgi:hypothetical protein